MTLSPLLQLLVIGLILFLIWFAVDIVLSGTIMMVVTIVLVIFFIVAAARTLGVGI